MSHFHILKRAWQAVWHYRALWLVGVVLALTTLSWEGVTLYSRHDEWEVEHLSMVDLHMPNHSTIRVPGQIRLRDNEYFGTIVFNYRHSQDGWHKRAGDIIVHYDPPKELSVEAVGMGRSGHLQHYTLSVAPWAVRSLLPLGIVLASGLLLLLVLGRVARYVSEAALLRMVDAYESAGTRYGFWQGLRLGWSRTAWRIFLINWCVNLGAAVGFVLLFMPVALPLMLWAGPSSLARALGAIAATGLFLVALVVVLLAACGLMVLKQLAWRACALEGLGVFASIRRGWQVFGEHSKDVGLMWLIMLGVQVIWPLLIAPLVLLTLALAGVFAGGSALLVGGVARLAWDGVGPWILAAIIGLPLFLLLLAGPLALLDSLRLVFRSSAWTLTYRELRGSESVARSQLGELAPSAAE